MAYGSNQSLRLGRVGRFASIILATLPLLIAPAPAQQAPTMPPPVQALGGFRHVPLTEEKAKAAIDIYLRFKEALPAEGVPSRPNDLAAALMAARKAEAIAEFAKEKGFADLDDWARTLTSLALAIDYVKQGSDEDIQAKLRDIEQAPMPEEMKARVKAMLQAMIPPQENIRVARQLLADPEWKKKIEAMRGAQ